MKILTINLNNKRNANIFTVQTDEGNYLLHGDIIVKYGIKLGEVENKIFNTALFESNTLIASEKAMKYLSSKLKTEQQIKDYLFKQGFNKGAVISAIEKLKNYGLIDDQKFALSYIRSNPKFSKNKLKQKLISFGVKQAVADDVLCNLDDADNCIADAQKYLKNKSKDNATMQKLTRHLMGKGYNYETIRQALNKLKFFVEIN